MVEPDKTRFVDGLALELDLARSTLEQLAIQLCLDQIVFERYADSLQQFDCVAQCIGEIATALRHDGNSVSAIEKIRLDSLRERLVEYHSGNASVRA